MLGSTLYHRDIVLSSCSFSDGTCHGVLYEMLNAEKKSLLLNLKHSDGPELLKKIIPSYDILLEGNRPGVMKKLGVSYEDLSRIHPGLIYCSLSGYGATGPYATRAGHDINYMAIAGALGLSGKIDHVPYLPGFQAADASGALSGAIGVLSALYARDASRDPTQRGKGQFVDVSLTESAMVLGLPTLSQALTEDATVTPRGKGALDGGLVNYNIYETKDGRYLAVGALEMHFWESFCSAMEQPELAKGDDTAVSSFFKTKTYDQWMEILSKLSGCCVEPVLEPSEVLKHPLHRERNAVIESSSNEDIASPQVVLGPRYGGINILS